MPKYKYVIDSLDNKKTFRNFVTIMNKHNYDSSASGYVAEVFKGVNQTFTDIEILHTSEVNVVAKAERYGRWWLLKGQRREVASEAAYRQRLRKEQEIMMMLEHLGIVSVASMELVDGFSECIVMEYLGDLTFRVVASANTRLLEGDTFRCSLIIEGEPLYLDDLRQGNNPSIVYVCGKRTGVMYEYI